MRRFFHQHQLVLGALVLVLGILAVFAYDSWEHRRTEWQSARTASQNVLALLTRDLDEEIRSLDMALEGVVQELQQDRLSDLPPDLRHLMLFRGVAPRGMGSILVFDHLGNIIEDQTAVTPRPGNYADRDYFKVHRTSLDTGLYISHPFKSRLHGTQQIVISRRVSTPDGSFAGVVGASISLSSLSDRFKNLALGQASTITLYRSDGIILVRQPFVENVIGRDLGGTPNFERFVAFGSGTIEGTAVTDGVRRQFEFGPVGRHPLILSVALSIDDIYAHWWREFATQVLVTSLVCCAILILVFMFQRELRRRTTAEAQLGKLALTDDLTGLPNRRAFREAYAQEWEQAIGRQTPVSLLYVDADCFKQYNDRYGHGKGDELLRAIARVLRGCVTGEREVASRYGGEEFLILLPETNEGRARSIAEHIREGVMKLHEPHDRNPYGRVTVSIGVGTAWPDNGTASDTLRQTADAALYRAKGAGRNCVRGAETDRNGLNVIPFGKK